MSKSKETALPEKTKRVKRLSLSQLGPCSVDESLKDSEYHYRLVDMSRPNQVNRFRRMGYEIVEDSRFVTGDVTVNNSTPLSSVATVELGRSKETKGVWMRIPKDIREEIQQEKEELVVKQQGTIGQSNIPGATGEITIGFDNKPTL